MFNTIGLTAAAFCRVIETLTHSENYSTYGGIKSNYQQQNQSKLIHTMAFDIARWPAALFFIIAL